MRTHLPLPALLLTATAAQAGSEGNTYFDIQGLVASLLICFIPVGFLVTLIVGVVWQRNQRLKHTNPRWSLSELPPFPTPGIKRTAPPPGT